ncbi:DUF5615 family PIN-like protein [Sphaerothrix gracilis]|uniref:DUF5615 family PIN-like protein n=1 Tax=Sphaerothrix gracilis TaxID=3151835 RepID=UPI0031FD5B07
MGIRLYIDENVPRQITTGLRLRKVDVLTVQEDKRSGIADPRVLERAAELQRVLFSMDDDLLAIAHQHQIEGKTFFGVIYAHQQNITIGGCIRDLELIVRVCDLQDLVNQVLFLPL